MLATPTTCVTATEGANMTVACPGTLTHLLTPLPLLYTHHLLYPPSLSLLYVSNFFLSFLFYFYPPVQPIPTLLVWTSPHLVLPQAHVEHMQSITVVTLITLLSSSANAVLDLILALYRMLQEIERGEGRGV